MTTSGGQGHLLKSNIMKILFLLMLTGASLGLPKWETNFEAAKKMAREDHKYILLNFSGSDWCGPCIQLHKEVFDTDAFGQLANNALVLYNADFPRSKKNQLPAEIQHLNETLADQYNPLGKFPYTLVLTPEGKIVKSWEGYPQHNSQQFIDQIKEVLNGGAH
jgi:thioredoxin-related protein